MYAYVLRWWERHGAVVLWTAVGCMAAAAAWRLTNELPRLIGGADGAFDMRLRHHEVQRWFAGAPVYGAEQRGDYPPASYVILWPLLGWLELGVARILWAVTSLAALAWLAWIAVREAGARPIVHVLLLALLPFSVYASSATLAMGQVMNHVLPALLASVMLLRRRPASWTRDVAAAALMVAALVKPPIAVPFFVLLVVGSGRLRPALLVIAGYAALTLFAAAFRTEPLPYTLFGWLSETPQVLDGHSNVHKWLTLVGLRPLLLPVSLAILAWLAWWLHRHQDAHDWILLGVCGVVAQLWLHHRLYDHLLLLVPMIPLFRIARDGGRVQDRAAAGLLFAATWATLHLPATLLMRTSPFPAIEAAQTIVWLTVLTFLLTQARQPRWASSSMPPGLRAAFPQSASM